VCPARVPHGRRGSVAELSGLLPRCREADSGHRWKAAGSPWHDERDCPEGSDRHRRLDQGGESNAMGEGPRGFG
ncbi:unnamed protein product, partial [Effrenium voratum]